MQFTYQCDNLTQVLVFATGSLGVRSSIEATWKQSCQTKDKTFQAIVKTLTLFCVKEFTECEKRIRSIVALKCHAGSLTHIESLTPQHLFGINNRS